jgi:Tfp pilus assembly protein PilX
VTRRVLADDARADDRGAALILVLVLCLSLAVMGLALGRYAQASSKSSTVMAAVAQRNAAADGALRLGIESLKLGESRCTTTMSVPAINGATITLGCTQVASAAAWLQVRLTVTAKLDAAQTTGATTVQIGRPGGSPCTSSCTVTINSWSVTAG